MHKHNIKGCLCNSLPARAVSVTWFESVCLAVGMKNVGRMRRTVVSSVTYLAVWYFSTLSHKWHDSQKICMEHKTCVLIFCKIFV
jgi:hypothetical protein